LPSISSLSLITMKFYNLFVLKFMQYAGGVWESVCLLTLCVPRFVPTRFPSIPFVFKLLRTLLRHDRHATLFESIRCALFPSSRGCSRGSLHHFLHIRHRRVRRYLPLPRVTGLPRPVGVTNHKSRLSNSSAAPNSSPFQSLLTNKNRLCYTEPVLGKHAS
jgi:hypothetical protein